MVLALPSEENDVSPAGLSSDTPKNLTEYLVQDKIEKEAVIEEGHLDTDIEQPHAFQRMKSLSRPLFNSMDSKAAILRLEVLDRHDLWLRQIIALISTVLVLAFAICVVVLQETNGWDHYGFPTSCSNSTMCVESSAQEVFRWGHMLLNLGMFLVTSFFCLGYAYATFIHRTYKDSDEDGTETEHRTILVPQQYWVLGVLGVSVVTFLTRVIQAFLSLGQSTDSSWAMCYSQHEMLPTTSRVITHGIFMLAVISYILLQHSAGSKPLEPGETWQSGNWAYPWTFYLSLIWGMLYVFLWAFVQMFCSLDLAPSFCAYIVYIVFHQPEMDQCGYLALSLDLLGILFLLCFAARRFIYHKEANTMHLFHAQPDQRPQNVRFEPHKGGCLWRCLQCICIKSTFWTKMEDEFPSTPRHEAAEPPAGQVTESISSLEASPTAALDDGRSSCFATHEGHGHPLKDLVLSRDGSSRMSPHESVNKRPSLAESFELHDMIHDSPEATLTFHRRYQINRLRFLMYTNFRISTGRFVFYFVLYQTIVIACTHPFSTASGKGSFASAPAARLGLYIMFAAYVLSEAYVHLPAHHTFCKFTTKKQRRDFKYRLSETRTSHLRSPLQFDTDGEKLIMQRLVLVWTLARYPAQHRPHPEQPEQFGNRSLDTIATQITAPNHMLDRLPSKIKFASSPSAVIRQHIFFAERSEDGSITYEPSREGRGTSVIAAFHDQSTDTYAYGIHLDDRLVISFRGTKTMKNISTDCRCWGNYLHNKIAHKHDMGDQDFRGSEQLRRTGSGLNELKRAELVLGAQVHAGFWEAFCSVVELIKEWLEEQDPKLPVLVCGHSLGGGLATLCCYWLASADMPSAKVCGLPSMKSHFCRRGRRISLWTFGAPRVGNQLFVNDLCSLGINDAWRIVNEDDIVPHLPRRNWCTLASRRYKHYGTLVLLSTEGNLVLSPSFIEWKITARCSSLTAMNNHRMCMYKTSLQNWIYKVHQRHADELNQLFIPSEMDAHETEERHEDL